MAIKILTQNGIDNTNIDGARGNNFNAGNRSGFVKGAFNEGRIFASTTNTIALDTCELRLSGHQIVIDEIMQQTFNNAPPTDLRMSWVAEIKVAADSTPTFRLFVQDSDAPLIQDNLFATEKGTGTYQLELCKFTHTTKNTIENIKITADIITGIALQLGETAGTAYEGNKGKILEEYKLDKYTLFNITPPLTKGYIRWDDGFLTTSGGEHSDYIYIHGAKSFNYKGNLSNVGNVISFYDVNKNYLQDISIRGSGTDQVGVINLSDEIYKNCYYIRYSTYTTGADYKLTINAEYDFVKILKNIDNRVSTQQVEINKKLNKDYLVDIDPDFMDGGYIDWRDGGITESSGKYTDYIEIGELYKITYSSNLSDAGAAVSFYDEYKNYLKDISIRGSGASSGIIDLTDIKYKDAKYFRYSSYYKDEEYTVKGIARYSLSSIKNEIEELKNKKVDKVTLFSYKPENSVQGYIQWNTGHIVESSYARATDFIPTDLGYNKVRYECSNLSDAGAAVSFYDEYKNYLKDISIRGSGASSGIIDLTDIKYKGAKYMRFSAYAVNDVDGLYFDAPYDITKIANEKPTKDIKMLVFGDSITETNYFTDNGVIISNRHRTNWLDFAKQYLDTENFMNYAKSGAGYKDRVGMESRQNMSQQIQFAIDNPACDDSEVIIISAGTNDGDSNIGDYETAMSKTTLQDLDRTKLYEAIRYVYWSLRIKYPNAVCFAGVPIQRASYEQPMSMIEAIKKMAQRYNFIIIDGYGQSGIIRDNEINQHLFLSDGLHPNADGSKKLGKLYASKVLEYFAWN